MKLRKTIAGVGAAAAVFAGSVLVAVPAIAQDDPTATTEDTAATVERCHGADLSTVADVLGIELDVLRDRLAGGETVADIAAEQGIAIDDVITALVSEAEAQLDAAVEDGRLTQTEADARLADAEARITDMVNGEFSFHGGGPRFGHGLLGLDAITEVLGMEPVDLLDQLRNGSTLGDIAAEQDVAVADLEEAMQATATERLQQAVADGQLTQEEADERLAEIDERIAAMIEGQLPVGPGFGHRHGHDGGPGSAPTDVLESNTTDA